MKAVRTVIYLLAACLVIGASVYGGYLLMRGTDLSESLSFQPPPPAGKRLVMSMDGFRLARSEGGGDSWLMNAGTADLYEDKEARLRDIEIIFKNPESKDATLLAERGTMDMGSGNASLYRDARDVRIVTSDGYLLYTASLSWKAGERQVWTQAPFKLLGSELYLEGTGMTADVDLRTIVVKNNVKAVLQE
jgi:LPS export ABC transporter protein LptC